MTDSDVVTDRRARTVRTLRGAPDVSVLIVGAGVNGAGLFRELALQGVDVLLVDRGDFCSGASAAPSRMIHGGLRYLEFGEFRLVRESVIERNRLLLNAPHYVAPLPTTIPLFVRLSGALTAIRRFMHLGGNRPAHRGSIMVKIGLTFYDLFTRKHRIMPKHRFASRNEAMERRPALHPETICTATYYDAWISYPERLCLELVLDAQATCPAARALNYASLRSATGSHVVLRDERTGKDIRVRPRVVVNATGAWIDLTNRRIGPETQLIGGTKGAHLVLDSPDLLAALDGEMIYYETPDGRVSVALPWLGKALVGSTDIRVDNPDDARCEEDEVDYILASIGEALPGVNVSRADIVSRFSGVRPLRYSNESTTGQVSRNHLCDVIEPDGETGFPILSMVGGKWTTFRSFAEQVADTLLDRLDLPRRIDTRDVPIGGGKDFPADDNAARRYLADLRDRYRLEKDRARSLLGRYGTRATEVAAFCAAAGDRPLTHHAAYTAREIEFIVRHEDVIHADDLVLRRTAIALLGELTSDLLDELLAIMRPIRNWSPDQTDAERERTKSILRDRHGIEFDSQE